MAGGKTRGSSDAGGPEVVKDDEDMMPLAAAVSRPMMRCIQSWGPQRGAKRQKVGCEWDCYGCKVYELSRNDHHWVSRQIC